MFHKTVNLTGRRYTAFIASREIKRSHVSIGGKPTNGQQVSIECPYEQILEVWGRAGARRTSLMGRGCPLAGGKDG